MPLENALVEIWHCNIKGEYDKTIKLNTSSLQHKFYSI